MCNLCGEDCEIVGHFLWNCYIYRAYSKHGALFLEHLKKNLGKKFEHLVGKSRFIMRTELWGSHYI